MSKRIDKILEELNLLSVPTYKEWLENWLGCAKTLNSTVSFFSLLKRHSYFTFSTREWDRKDDIDKNLLYKKWYNEDFLPSHFGIEPSQEYLDQKKREEEFFENTTTLPIAVVNARRSWRGHENSQPMFIKNDSVSPLFPASSCFRSDAGERKALSLKVGESTSNASGNKITRVF